MKIERKKVKNGSDLCPATKAKMIALLGVSAAFTITACASSRQHEEVSQNPRGDDIIEEPLGGDVAALVSEIPESSSTGISSSSESSIPVMEPLGGMIYIPDSTDEESGKTTAP